MAVKRKKHRKRKITIVEKKLGREHDYGRAFLGCDYIEVEERLKGKKMFCCHLHECLHILFPEEPEYQIDRKSRLLCDTLWNQSYRRVDNLLK